VKIFEYEDEIFMVNDKINYVAWDESGSCYGYYTKPFREYDYSKLDTFGIWNDKMHTMVLDDEGTPNTKSSNTFVSFERLWDYNRSQLGYVYGDWDKHLIDVNAICIHADGLEDL
jgi:hypothetical protein